MPSEQTKNEMIDFLAYANAAQWIEWERRLDLSTRLNVEASELGLGEEDEEVRRLRTKARLHWGVASCCQTRRDFALSLAVELGVTVADFKERIWLYENRLRAEAEAEED